MVWSHRADLGGVGKTRAMHGPRNMVALGLQDLWAAGVGPKWALRLPGQRTQGWGAGQTTSLQITKRGGRLGEATSYRRSKSDNCSKNNSRKGETDEGAYEGQQLCGLAAVRISGTDGTSSLRRATSDEETYHKNGRSA
jgi:hypothetical protein